MIMLEAIFDSNWLQPLGWMLIHSVWQICAIAIVFLVGRGLIRFAFPTQNSSPIYVWGCTCLAVMLIAPMATFVWVQSAVDAQSAMSATTSFSSIYSDSESIDATESGVELTLAKFAANGIAEESPRDVATSISDQTSAQFVWLVPVWISGVLFVSFRPLLGLWNVRRLRKTGRSRLPEYAAKIAHSVVTRMGIRRTIEFANSKLVQVPTVVGAIRPLVLLPMSTLTGLTAEQLQQVLAHELAHIRRHDYVVNLAQAFAETLFFFHPAVWWLSKQIRVERESCCDDIAVNTFGDAQAYAQALLSLEGLRSTAPPALAASGGTLQHRISRLLNEPLQSSRSGWPATVISTLGIVALAATFLISTNEPNFASDQAHGLKHDESNASVANADGENEFGNSTEIPIIVNEDQDELPRSKKSTDSVLAIVNGVPVMASAVVESCTQKYGRSMLKKLIAGELILDQAQKDGFPFGDFPKPVIDDELTKQAASIGMTLNEYVRTIAEKKFMTEDAARQMIFEQTILRYWVKQSGYDTPESFEEMLKSLRDKAQIIPSFLDPKQRKLTPHIAATVNGQEITMTELQQECLEAFAKLELESIISATIISSQNEFRQLDISMPEIEKLVAQEVETQKGKMPAGMVDAATWVNVILPFDLRGSALLRKLIEADQITVSGKEIRRAYTHEYGVRANVLTIVLNDQPTAMKVWNLAQHNPVAEHFGKLANTYSVEPSSKANFGEIPPLQKHGDQPVIEAAAFGLRHGQISDVIQTNGKFVIMFSKGLIHVKNLPAMESVKNDLSAVVLEKKTKAAMSAKFAELRESADIQRFPVTAKSMLNLIPQKDEPEPSEKKWKPTPANNNSPANVRKSVKKDAGETD